MTHFVLSNETFIPAIGFGTWQTPSGDVAIASVKAALEAGYRHIDTATIYANEDSIGTALAHTNISRQELFITSKVWNNNTDYASVQKAFKRSLADLQLDYLDLYLLHWPANTLQHKENWKRINAEKWRALEDLYKAGKIKAIGVSNFLVHHLEALKQTAEIFPMVNQIEFHPGQMQAETLQYCRANGILVEAWGPLGTGKMLNNETLIKIAGKYDKSVAQICIRWCLQNGTLPLPKSINPVRIRENLQVNDFLISDEDMGTINSLPYIGGSGLHPDIITF